MHLTSLTLRGFKSFASATTLRLEPGITCVVGPNGSGKSNVVDALTWVMGEQGVKTLRGGAMSDVVFAGAAGRPALGRAEVTLTFDNSDGRLPLDAAEVSVTRLLFRGGGSEYAINGSACRLLDVQELLSDAGIGREMHVVVGQGRLDSVLQATPEDRRALLEEAAGVLKHRRRKEKALRKLDAVAANTARLDDLVGELGKRLKPLGRQAKAARRAAQAQAVARAARRRLLADDLVHARTVTARDAETRLEGERRRAAVETDRAGSGAEAGRLETAVVAHDAALADARALEARLSELRERLRGTARVAAQRAELLVAEPEEASSGRDPDRLERDAAAARQEQTRLDAAAQQGAAELQQASRARVVAEEALAAEERALAVRRRAVLDRREGLARLQAQAEAARGRAAAGAAEITRLEASLAASRGRLAELQAALAEAQGGVGSLDADEAARDAAHEAAEQQLADVEERVRALREQERVADRERSAAAARADALRSGLQDGDAGLPDDLPGLLGGLAGLVHPVPGGEAALAAALGPDAEALAVADLEAAVAVLDAVRERGTGVRLLVGGAPAAAAAAASGGEAPAGSVGAVALVAQAPDELWPALVRVLGGVVVVDDLAAARRLLAERPDVRCVMRSGELLGVAQASGGTGGSSRLELRAAAESAAAAAEVSESELARLATALSGAEQERAQLASRAEQTLEALHASDAAIAAHAEQLADRASAFGAAVTDVSRTEDALSRAREASETARRAAAEVEDRWAAAAATEDGPAGAGADATEPSGAERDRLAGAASAARAAEVEARLSVRTAEERARASAGRAESLERAARAERAARERAAARRVERARSAAVAGAVDDVARAALERLGEALDAAVQGRQEATSARGDDAAALTVVREHAARLDAEHASLVESAHREDVARTELRLRVEALEARVREETGETPDALVAEAGPHVPVVDPDVGDGAPDAGGPDGDDDSVEGVAAEGAGGEASVGRPYDRAETEEALARAEAELARIGAVNPLALEEYAAVEQRHGFLAGQLADLAATRRDLLSVVRDVDARVRDAVRDAFTDVSAEFTTVFSTLFPGGEGRLVLTDPDDLLVTGIEIEARPPGKRVKRLSLLSGGERSLTAVAFLVALFRARPSPFYVLDEVEAALDDTNLRRLLLLLEELRRTSQLIVVTHQKRTMEIADALYGVTMRDGTSAVISQRLRSADNPVPGGVRAAS